MKPCDLDLAAEQVRSLFDLDPAAGILVWKPRHSAGATWNTRYAGVAAGSVSRSRGYVEIGLCGRQLLAHRVIWLHHHGKMPLSQIDHVNGVRSDNRLLNLREASHSENARNAKLSRSNTTGLKGAYRHVGGRWQAKIMAEGRVKHLGLFDSPEEAHAAYANAAMTLYGQFARLK